MPDPIEALDADLTRVAERLRHLVTVRLSAPLGDGGGSAADAGHALAQQLADLDAALHGLPARAVPRLADAAVGDQVAVIGADLVAALRERPDPATAQRAAELTVRLRRLL